MSRPFSDLLHDYMHALDASKCGYGSGPSLREAAEAIDAFFDVPDFLLEGCVPAEESFQREAGPTLAVLTEDRNEARQPYADIANKLGLAPLQKMTDEEVEARSRTSAGERLRWLRQQSGRSMGDLARFLKCSVVEVSRIERGRAINDIEDYDGG